MRLNDIIEGMMIVAKYTPDQFCVQAEHDQLFCGDGELPLTPEEKSRMEALGWFNDEGSWSCHT